MKPVFVTTCINGRIGFWFGYVPDNQDMFKENLRLEKARSIRYLKCDRGGVLGAAVFGPDKGSKIGPETKECYVNHVTSITPLEKDGEEKWLKSTWG